MKTKLAVEKPTIKILLYTDDPRFSLSENFDQFLGLGLMVERLNGHAPTFADISTTLVNRSNERHADNKLDAVLARESFDEIWFFGAQQVNTTAEPESELTPNEVEALRQWMEGSADDGSEGGGVLITGDHANPLPAYPLGDIPDDVDFLGLGRAIGRYIPRAGLLRKWEGPPTARSQDSYNTLVGSAFQMDRVPQELFLQNVNEDGEPDPDGQPHPLFFYGPDQCIEVFPDHGHEGAVLIPETLDDSWPTGPSGQTQPYVVARGRDRRNGHMLNLIAAYNGDLASVGRIVSDSTWHHYTNLNLLGFEYPAPVNSAADRIGQFYANLAVWLAPRSKRMAMAQAMFSQIAEYTLQQEPQGEIENLGLAAQSLLSTVASPCEAHELIEVLLLNNPNAVCARGRGHEHQQLRNLFLGNVVSLYQKAIGQAKREGQNGTYLSEPKAHPRGMDVLLNVALNRARQHQSGPMVTTQQTSIPSACASPSEEWTISTVADGTGTKGMLVFCLNLNSGNITGQVSAVPVDDDGVVTGDPVVISTTVTGTDEQVPYTESSLMTLNFNWGAARAIITGVRLREDTPDTFTGRFTIFGGAELAKMAAAGADEDSTTSTASSTFTAYTPSDGDTGTGTGTQT